MIGMSSLQNKVLICSKRKSPDFSGLFLGNNDFNGLVTH